ncbi:MAG: alpha-galactosidase, partial [Anaerolineales bacterium]|nr:alpha-galactosidase [Anaerolineales bacterium]
DGDGRLTHLAWGPTPNPVTGHNRFAPPGQSSFEFQGQRDELPAYGPVSVHEVALKVSFPNPPAALQPGEAPHRPIRDVRLAYTSHEIIENGQLPTAHSSLRTPHSTLRILLTDPLQPLTVTLCYRLFPAHDVIERWCELTNTGPNPIRVEKLAFAALHLSPGASEVTTVHGAWGAEFTTQRHTLPVGSFNIGHRSVQTGHAFNPFFLANRPGQATETSGPVYFGALAFSGAWLLTFEHQHSGDVRVFGGYNPFDFELILQPGQTHTTPAFVCGVSDAGWGGASRRLHVFTRDAVLPNVAPRPVLYNSWEATYFALSHEGQAALARKAAAIGVELFVVDDGWFGGRRSPLSGLGDWTVSPEVFPNGLQPLIDEVHALGMQFGLWFEPEMVNPDSDLYRQHPDWVLHFPGRPRTEARMQLVLDYGRAEVIDTIFNALDAILATHDIDFIKWDMNRNVTEPGSVAGKAIWRAHAAGVYGLMDRLRQKYPNLSLQSCSGGGGRVDLGILRRVDQVWTSDNTDALDRLEIQRAYSLIYPPRAMRAWVTDVPNFLSQRSIPLQFRFHSAMMGSLGVGCDLTAMSEEDLSASARFVAEYKQLRPLMVAFHRLENPSANDYRLFQYASPEGAVL